MRVLNGFIEIADWNVIPLPISMSIFCVFTTCTVICAVSQMRSESIVVICLQCSIKKEMGGIALNGIYDREALKHNFLSLRRNAVLEKFVLAQ